MAAGLSLAGKIPIFHSIAPFICERGFEQLKIDFGYQQLGGNFVSVGASYDYSGLGCTHHCPGDVAILKTIPNMEIFVPGHPDEFDDLFRKHYSTGNNPKYFRLSERSNAFPKLNALIKKGSVNERVVLVIGPMLDRVREACKDLDVFIYYSTCVSSEPPGTNGLKLLEKPVLVVPFYEGSMPEFQGLGLEIGVPRKFLTNYGTVAEHDEACGLTAPQIRKRIMEYFNL